MYIPWAGLFDQIKNCNIFVHYDDVQLPQGRSFCSRVQVKINERIYWLSIPLIKSSRGLIKDVIIDNSKEWQQDHINKLKESLPRAEFYNDIVSILTEAYELNFDNLSDLNIFLIEKITSYLNIKVQFFRSSQFDLATNSSQKLLDLCKIFNADDYITGHGAKNYLDHKLFDNHGIKVKYMDYNIIPYYQDGQFIPYVTILDLVAKHGIDSIKYLKSQTLYWKDFIQKS